MIEESGSEVDDLDSSTWATAVAGRRLYPRIKRYVADAWKMIQMKRDEWEFKSVEYTGIVNPRVKFMEGDAAVAPVVGAIFVGDESGFTFTVSSIILDSGTWAAGDAQGQFEFTVHSGAIAPIMGETFTATGSKTFVYSGRGAYDFSLSASDLNEIQWPTMIATNAVSMPIPVIFVPWDNWEETSFSYASGGQVAPMYVSQDPLGRAVFFAQTLDPFRVFFVYTSTPQVLTDYDDTPTGLPAHYHEWIAWEALKKLALYDKNMALFNHAEDTAKLFRRAAEKNLMPKMRWAESPFNE